MTPLRSLFAFIAVMGLSACSNQSAAEVSAAFASALDACSKPMAEDVGAFDQKAIAAAGWIITSRIIHNYENADERKADLTKLGALKAKQYENTKWQNYKHMNELEVIRGYAKTRPLPDVCRIHGQVNTKEDAASVIASITKKTGFAIARKGEIPRGGDFLTPRFDGAPYSYYWELPQHNVYLTEFDGHAMRLDIEAVPDRSKLDPNFDTPEHRIPSGDSTK
jgi:hypothetical protein